MGENVLIDEKINDLQNLTKKKISYQDIADIFGVTRSAIQNRVARKVPLKEFEESILDEAFGAIVTKEHNITQDDIINIPYWEELPDALKHPEYNYVPAQRISIEQGWGAEAENLRIIPMIGDKMTNYWYPIRPNDVLIIDTSHDYILGNGVYFATSRNNTRFWVREMQMLLDMSIEIKGYSPSGETVKRFKTAELEEADFRIIGKVIKNVSFRL